MILENWNIEDITGYEVKTTFYMDFSISEMFGVYGIVDTYDTSFETWKDNYEFITELCMVLNWKMWRWYKENEEFYLVYRELYTKLDEWCIENLKGDELDYYYSTTD